MAVLHPSCHYSGLKVFMVPIYNKFNPIYVSKAFPSYLMWSWVLFLNFLSMIVAPGMIKLFSFHQLPLIASFFRKCLCTHLLPFWNSTQFPKPSSILKVSVKIIFFFLFTRHFYKNNSSNVSLILESCMVSKCEFSS